MARVPVLVPVLSTSSGDPKIGLMLTPGVGETGRVRALEVGENGRVLDPGVGETGDLRLGLVVREYGVL